MEEKGEEKGDILLFKSDPWRYSGACLVRVDGAQMRALGRGSLIGSYPPMPRTARASQGGYYYHVIHRGNGRSKVFPKRADYAAFVKLMADYTAQLNRPVPAHLK